MCSSDLTPFRNCLTTMTLRDLGPSKAALEWSATFEADGLPASEAVEMLEGALAANCLALKQFMEAGRKQPAHWVAGPSRTIPYKHVVKTDSAWAGTCRRLIVKLIDGAEHKANFKFK